MRIDWRRRQIFIYFFKFCTQLTKRDFDRNLLYISNITTLWIIMDILYFLYVFLHVKIFQKYVKICSPLESATKRSVLILLIVYTYNICKIKFSIFGCTAFKLREKKERSCNRLRERNQGWKIEYMDNVSTSPCTLQVFPIFYIERKCCVFLEMCIKKYTEYNSTKCTNNK